MNKCAKRKGGKANHMKHLKWIKPDRKNKIKIKRSKAKKVIEEKFKKMTKQYQHLRDKRKSKKDFQNGMKDQGKRSHMLKQTSNVLPFVQIHDNYILLKEGVMDIFQVQTKNIHALNDADLNYLLLNRAQFLRSYFRSFKEVILNFPTNTEVQKAYWLKKRKRA